MAALKFRTKTKDYGMTSAISQVGKMTRGISCLVGVMGNDDHGDGLTVVDIASFHEFGTSKIPKRSFVRATTDANLPQIRNMQNSGLLDVVFRNVAPEQAIGRIGAWLSGQMQKRISDGIPPPLKDATIRHKNRRQLAGAKEQVQNITAKADRQGYRAAQKSSGTFGPARAGYAAKLNDNDKQRLNKKANLVITGGSSTALIDTGQLRRSITWLVKGGK